MDTKFWIDLKNNSDKLTEFQRKVEENDVEVLFSSGNFLDLVKAQDQDRLSEIIAETVDTYIPLQSRDGEYYEYSDTLYSLIPTPDDRSEFIRQARFLDDDLALKYLYRTSDWEPPKEYIQMTKQIKKAYDKFGFENAMRYILEEYLEEDGDVLRLDPDDVSPVDYIRGMLELYRVQQIKDEENPDANDYVDMVICSHAILTDGDSFLIERKWIIRL